MRAIVCDCCGKVVLLEETVRFNNLDGIHHLSGPILGRDGIDLCTECAEKLVKATKGQEAET